MRKSRLHTLAGGLLLSAIAVVLTGAVFAFGFLLMGIIDPDLAVIISLGLGLALALVVLPLAAFVYVLRASHRSWKVNLARYPAVKAAIGRYREEGEGVRRLLPAFVVNGRRYFLVKYGRKNREWAPDRHETGMLVLDEQGRVQNDEAMFISLLGAVRHVEESYLHDSLVAQENMMAVGRRMEREAAKAREFFLRLVHSAGQPELMEDIEMFLVAITDQVRRGATRVEAEYHWCRKNRKRVEFTLEEMKPLEEALEESSVGHIETAARIAQAWARVEGQRARLESLRGLSSYDRARQRKLLDALRVAAESLSEVDSFRMHVVPERMEAYRSRTSRALQLERQAQPSASPV